MLYKSGDVLSAERPHRYPKMQVFVEYHFDAILQRMNGIGGSVFTVSEVRGNVHFPIREVSFDGS